MDAPLKRRSVRLPAYDYASHGAYFVTLVAAARACVFGEVQDVRLRKPRHRVQIEPPERLLEVRPLRPHHLPVQPRPEHEPRQHLEVRPVVRRRLPHREREDLRRIRLWAHGSWCHLCPPPPTVPCSLSPVNSRLLESNTHRTEAMWRSRSGPIARKRSRRSTASLRSSSATTPASPATPSERSSSSAPSGLSAPSRTASSPPPTAPSPSSSVSTAASPAPLVSPSSARCRSTAAEAT